MKSEDRLLWVMWLCRAHLVESLSPDRVAWVYAGQRGLYSSFVGNRFMRSDVTQQLGIPPELYPRPWPKIARLDCTPPDCERLGRSGLPTGPERNRPSGRSVDVIVASLETLSSPQRIRLVIVFRFECRRFRCSE